MKKLFAVTALCAAAASFAGAVTFPEARAQSYYGQRPAGNVADVTLLEEEVRRLNGRVEELENRLRRLENGNVAGVSAPAATPSVAPGLPSVSVQSTENYAVRPAGAPSVAAQAAAANAPFGAPSAAPQETLSPREIYDQGLNALKRGDYATSRNLLSTFVSNNEGHALMGNAQYWLGESYYAQNDYKEAAKHFLKGYQSNTDGIKAPDNLLKLAMSLHAMGKNAEACTTIDRMYGSFSEEDRPVALGKAGDMKKQWNCAA